MDLECNYGKMDQNTRDNEYKVSPMALGNSTIKQGMYLRENDLMGRLMDKELIFIQMDKNI